MSKIVSEKVCFVKGHLIQSVVKEEALDPSTKLLVSDRTLICIQCGKSRDEILNEKPSVSRPRKAKAVSGEEAGIDNLT